MALSSSKLFPGVLLLLLLLVATEMRGVEGAPAVCLQVRCPKCVGACTFDDECSITCRNDGYDSGECRGAHHRCICYRYCSTAPPTAQPAH